MSKLIFSKMHGAGNDFILLDIENKDSLSGFSGKLISTLCHRTRGIGADGLIILYPLKRPTFAQDSGESPLFRMKFFNNDGKCAEMCGNGLRCASLYARKYLTESDGPVFFETDAGLLKTERLSQDNIRIQMPLIQQPSKVTVDGYECMAVNTGVPHLIVPVSDVSDIDVVQDGRKLRYNKLFEPHGVNVDFVSLPQGESAPVLIRTYERGVEDETSACGTGIAAAAAALGLFFSMSPPITFMTRDKDVITIEFSLKENMVKEIQEIRLTGPAEEVFRGELSNYFLSS